MSNNQTHGEREKLTIRHMVAIYCRGQRHAAAGAICGRCAASMRYAHERIEKCPFGAGAKPACGLCRSNCFTPEMHASFRRIMGYAGPRMMLRHPVLTLAHVWDAIRFKRGEG